MEVPVGSWTQVWRSGDVFRLQQPQQNGQCRGQSVAVHQFSAGAPLGYGGRRGKSRLRRLFSAAYGTAHAVKVWWKAKSP